MDASEEATVKSVTALEDEEPSSAQSFPKNRGRSNSPPWKKILVYDCEKEAVEVRSEKNIDCKDWLKVDLPPKCKQITIFVDPETESKPTTDSKGENGKSNVILATLYLNLLGAYYQVQRSLGLLSTLYMANAAPWSETASQVIGSQKPEHIGE